MILKGIEMVTRCRLNKEKMHTTRKGRELCEARFRADGRVDFSRLADVF